MENELKNAANRLRRDIVTTIYKAKDGHPGPSLGIADIVAVLYFNEMNIRPEDPDYEDRDRLILSKGHSCPCVYSALAERGYFSKESLPTLRSFGSILQGHPCITTPGIDMTSGSLGNGISVGLGMELARQYNKKDYYTYVITGDGELNEGVVWEGIMGAKKNKASHLIVFVDNNGHQSGGEVKEISDIEPIAEKFVAFGWNVLSIDGNNVNEIIDAIHKAKQEAQKPTAIVCKTVKGKGVSFMENNNAWHKGKLTDEQYEQAMKDLGGEAL